MTGKFFLYCAITFLVIWAMDSININGIFKKNRILQARIFYFLLGISMKAACQRQKKTMQSL